MYPVAQKLQVSEHPTWEETQAVTRSRVGINTPSMRFLSCNWKLDLMVRSELICASAVVTICKENFSESHSRVVLGTFPIASKLRAAFFQIHSYTCFARNAGSPAASISAFSCSKLRFRIATFFSNLISLIIHSLSLRWLYRLLIQLIASKQHPSLYPYPPDS